jgi:hypothetical protein
MGDTSGARHAAAQVIANITSLDGDTDASYGQTEVTAHEPCSVEPLSARDGNTGSVSVRNGEQLPSQQT